MNSCQSAACGDGVTRTDVEAGQAGYEACDDANEENADACLNDCTAASCGDSVRRTDLQPGQEGYESCDDGNEVDNDACHNDCTPARCGDGMVFGDEVCDDGNQVNTDACLNTCVTARCGDSVASDLEAGQRALRAAMTATKSMRTPVETTASLESAATGSSESTVRTVKPATTNREQRGRLLLGVCTRAMWQRSGRPRRGL